MSEGAWGKAFERLRAAAAGLPEVEESTWFGTPSLKVRKKSLVRVKDAETVVLMCPLEEKEMLLSAAPEIFYETDHYRGWPAILIRIHHIAPDELRHRLERAWRMQAPKRLVAALDRERESTSGS
ncbi:MmcQ/YjbR family DNA-binding protein [Chelativorans salis]|uniref:MmcQ/YjbR family DNA-binding protein n=1 Tax=Chelativorans salis TaxID=2978478 RepID=A0ABT2LIM9_9HYPH|nr:MmcQ/YjbR family DNA-binding protein [Chelativorans sp. EGI FJ00035]MCT7374437.1 MmcQ/YjbR family DNA-binding protein [Chelativorans sp. EGI FJ00035]